MCVFGNLTVEKTKARPSFNGVPIKFKDRFLGYKENDIDARIPHITRKNLIRPERINAKEEMRLDA